MTIENLIIRSIYQYPDVFYKKTWEESRMCVLEHYFMVLGNGEDLIKKSNSEKYTFNSTSLPKDKRKYIEENIKNGIVIYKIQFVDKTNVLCDKSSKFLFPAYNYKNIENIFEDEYKNKKLDYKEFYSKINVNDEFPDYGYSKYPKNNSKCNNFYYPFSFYYLPFVKINPFYKNYDYNTIQNMTVEELRESKNLLPDDYNSAIVEIFKLALDFYNNDDKFLSDIYYSWKDDNLFDKKFDDAKLNIENWNKFCKDYNNFKDFNCEKQEFIDSIIKKSREKYIKNCEKIIKSFS